ncbi:predicted protein [Histoplasma capsulatum var. duboisii H88]|uniref:Predicted protein n=2 Tax=Ajellomyces capsulatus TaxID=5037 RepID=F0UDG7_AJEC8|nr:predicted protein [Histoplasma capsulatum H143]EGC42708.1 predicted protein [Histoplasma capsulatum var. duboisii H88]
MELKASLGSEQNHHHRTSQRRRITVLGSIPISQTISGRLSDKGNSHKALSCRFELYLTSQAMLRVFCHGRHAASSRAIAVQRAVGCSDIMLPLMLLSTINNRLSVDFSVDINYPQHFAFWAS